MSEPENRITRIQALLKDPKADSYALDQAVWAYFRKVDFPLTHYDEETFRECRSEGDPEARGVSDANGFLLCLEASHPGVRLKIETGGEKIRVYISVSGYGIGVSGTYRGPFGFAGIGRAIAHAGLDADHLACSLRQRLLQVAGVADAAPPGKEWPIEELPSGRFHAVLHDLRLCAPSGSTPEKALEYAGMNHKGDHGMMICRERYDKLMHERDNDQDDPAP